MAVVHGSYGAPRFERVRPSMADLQRPFAVIARNPFSRSHSPESQTECPSVRTTDEVRQRRSDQSLVSNVKEVHRSDIRLANGPLGVADDVCVGRAVEELLVVATRDFETIPVGLLIVLLALRLAPTQRASGRCIVEHQSLAMPAALAFNPSIHRTALAVSDFCTPA